MARHSMVRTGGVGGEEVAFVALPDPRFLGHSIKELIRNSHGYYPSLERMMFGLSKKGVISRGICAHINSLGASLGSETEPVLGETAASS